MLTIKLRLYNGQNQNEVPATFIKSDLEFPFLDDRMVIHINCSALSMKAKKNLFSSTRERSKEGALLKEILQLVHPFAPFITEEINTILFDERIIT